MDNEHIVLIRSDGSVVYEDGYEPIFDDEDAFEEDEIDDFD